ncbi:MAG: metal ABC transporter substrate-binding protein [Planctomycetota bacterium]
MHASEQDARQKSQGLRRALQVFAIVCFMLAAVILLVGQRTPGRLDGPPRVVVSIPPLLWPVQALADPDADITLLVPPGVSAHHAQLSPEHVTALGQADLVVLTGLDLEPQIRRIMTQRPAAWRDVVHLPEMDAERFDPHAWLDADVMREFVDLLIAQDGDWLRDDALEVAEELRATINDVDAAYRDAFEQLEMRRIVTDHHAYHALERRYGLEVVAVFRPTNLEPTAGDIAAVRAAIEAKGVQAIYIEPQFDGRAARIFAESLDMRIGTLDPLGDGDWPGMMRANLQALVDGLGG